MKAYDASHKEMTKHIRHRLAVSGVKARCHMCDSCGQPVISIATPTYEARFSEDEQRTILQIVEANRLTGARQSPIDTDRMTYEVGGRFEFHG